MNTNPHQQLTPENRVHELAHTEPGLTDKEVLDRLGWNRYTEGTLTGRELLAAYHAAEPVQRWADGLKSHAMDWACNGMRSDYDTAEAYSNHMVAMHRAGDMTALTSHKVEYPAWLARYEAQAELEA